jgi:hypothetical protein
MTQIRDISPLYSKKKITEMSNNFLNQKKIIKIASNNFPILSENNMLIYLSLHFFHHNFRGIFRMEFLHIFIKTNYQKNIVWADIMNKINHYEIVNFIFPVFILLKKYFQTPIPSYFIDNLAIRNNKYFKKVTHIRIFDDQGRGEAGIERLLNIFNFSNSPIYKKVLIIFNRQFISFTFLILKARLSSFLKNHQ